MQDPSSKKQSPKKKLFQRGWFWILIGLILLVVLFFCMLPIGIDYGIEAYLKNQGADQVNIEDVDFNPLTGRLTLTNLSVIIGAQTALQIPEATFKIQWTPFVRKRFVLERFTISDTLITVEELENSNWRIGGITLPQSKETSEPSSWNFSFQEATVINSRVKLISARLKSQLIIEKAKLLKLTSWLQEDNARLELSGKLNDAPMQLQMDVSPFGGEMVVAGLIKLSGLNLKPFAQLLQPQINTLEGRVDVDLKIDTRHANDNGLKHHQEGPVRLHQVRTQIGDIKLSKEDLTWEGGIRIDIPQSQEALKINAEGRMDGSMLSLAIENENLKVQEDNFNWKGKVNYAQDQTNQDIKADGEFSVEDVKLESPAFNLSENKLTWNGALEFSAKTKTDDQRFISNGALEGSKLRVVVPDHKLTFEHQGLSWKGRLDTGEINDYSALKAETDVILKDFQILHSETEQRLLDTNQIDLQAIKIDGLNSVTLLVVVLNELALLAERESAPSPEADSTPLRIQDIKFENVQLSQQKNLAIETVQLTGVKGFLHRDREGKWPAIDRLASIRSDASSGDQTRRAKTDTQTNKKSDKLDYRIGQINIAGDSGLQFKDERASPAFAMVLSIVEASLANIDSSRPQQPVSVKLLVSDKKDARISLDGTMQPLAEKLSLDWVGKVQALELPPLSPFAIQNTGYRFVSGELQADVPVKINQNQLDGNIDLILFNPKVERVKAEPTTEENQGKISVPLDSALKLMRDKQNNVRLNIPISGNINDPEFSIADAVNKVLVKTLQTSALSYLKFALGPYGIGLAVAEQVITGNARIRLNPIAFEPGSDQLDAAAIDYIQRVSTIMREYPEIQVSVCGVATESDRALVTGRSDAQSTAKSDEANTALLTLADQRSAQVQNQLNNAHGITAKRIIDCKPVVDKNADARPRVDLDI
ncbi:MAG: DUF748 domain-containing protein [Desulfobacterales bacterium]|nr:DUF748 domain-containing protein [Desulfobacterales bacterium]